MSPQFFLGLSLMAVAIALTLAKEAWIGAPMYLKAGGFRSRHPRSAYIHMPCAYMSQLQDIKDRFKRWFDSNDDGHATFDEVKNFLLTLRPDITDDVVRTFIRRRDTDRNGAIELIPEYARDFVEGEYGPEVAAEWFHLHDLNGDGLVSESEIIHLGEAIGLTRDQAKQTALEYYLPMDVDGDESLNAQEFEALYAPPPGYHY